MSIKLSETPREHYTELFETLIEFRGVKGAKRLLQIDETLKASFPWCLSKRGHKFWEAIDNGQPTTVTTTTTTTTTTETVDELAAEAESRGFKIGVWTKFGKIDGGIDHELCDDGSFYYRNIKVRSKKGKWCKPNVKPASGTFYSLPNIIPSKVGKDNETIDVTSEKEVVSAIHEVLEHIFKNMHK